MGLTTRRSYPKRSAAALAVALLAALALSACGSSATRRTTAGSLSPAIRTELTYFPAGDPLLLTLQTNPSSPAVQAANQLADGVPTLIAGVAALKLKLQSIGIDYATAVRPLLGNPLMLGFAGATPTVANSSEVLLSWVTASAAKLRALIDALRVPQSATDGAARLYTLGSETLAVEGATALLGRAATVRAALARHATPGRGFSSAEYAALTGAASRRALVTIAGDLASVLARPSATKARRVPWVAAIRGYSATLNANAGALTLRIKLQTSPSGLSDAELPLAATTAAPRIAASGAPITVGLSDPAALLRFVLAAQQQTGARQLAALGPGALAAARALIDQLGPSAILASDGHTTLARAAVTNAARARAALATLALAHHDARALGNGFYRTSANTIIGIADGEFLLGERASITALRAFATAPSIPAPGAHGPLAFRISLGQLLGVVLKHRPSGIAAGLLAQLGDISGWVRDSTSALTGQATLALH